MTDTRTKILDVAEQMIRSNGYHAVSFRDIAASVNIKAASIHYHFPSKELLAIAMVERYRKIFVDGRQSIASSGVSPAQQLRRYAEVLVDVFRRTGRMCLCGVLSAEASSLPAEVNAEVQGFFADNESWLADVLDQGRRAGELRFEGTPVQAASALFASFEGALMSAWTFNDENRLIFTLNWLLGGLKA